ncbi:MAG: hypothetical protein QXP20_03015 [Candidatus Bathyarchaeia archaeon]
MSFEKLKRYKLKFRYILYGLIIVSPIPSIITDTFEAAWENLNWRIGQFAPWYFCILWALIIALHLPYPKYPRNGTKVNPYFLCFIFGTMINVFDDVLALTVGLPFRHHSLFHSFTGVALNFAFFYLVFNRDYAIYSAAGELWHILFNWLSGDAPLFFPFTSQIFGLRFISSAAGWYAGCLEYYYGLGFAIVTFIFYLKDISWKSREPTVKVFMQKIRASRSRKSVCPMCNI